MRARLKKIGDRLRRLNFRITRGGLLFGLALALVAGSAAVSANNLLFLILAMMLATVMISSLVARLCLAGLELDFLAPEHVAAGRPTDAKLYVRNSKFFMPSFSIHVVGIGDRNPPAMTSSVYFPLIPARRVLEESVQIRFSRRGAHRRNTFAFTTRFPFGFLEKMARVTLLREVIVYPSIDPHPGFEDLLAGVAGEIETHYMGTGRDFYRIRPYQPLESARHVDWRATAHTGELQVREFAREQERTVEIFLDRDLPVGCEEWFEHAVDCCAFLSWSLDQQGTSLRFRSQEYDCRVPEEGDVYAVLRFLALARPYSGKIPEGPADETNYQIVFSAAPQRFDQARWNSARILSPETFPALVN